MFIALEVYYSMLPYLIFQKIGSKVIELKRGKAFGAYVLSQCESVYQFS